MPACRHSLFPSGMWLAAGAGLVALTTTGCASWSHGRAQSRDSIVAIDVALERDASSSAEGRASVTLVQSLVRGSELHLLSAALGRVMATSTLQGLALTPSAPRSDATAQAAASATTDVPHDLRRLQERVAEAVRPFSVDSETATSFIVALDGSPLMSDTFTAVERFVPDASGVNYVPRVSAAATGASGDPSAFRPVGLAIYQLGHAGTPPRKIWTWTRDDGAR